MIGKVQALAAVLLGLVAMVLSQAPVLAADPPVPTETPGLNYTLERIEGNDVQVLEEGQTEWEKAEEGQVLEEGDEIRVGEKSDATLMLEDETSVQLGEKSDMKVGKVGKNDAGGFFSRLSVLAGRLLADVKKNLQESGSSFEVEANGVVCGVRGTAFEVSSNGEEAQVTTHEGKVEVAGGEGLSRMVAAGNFTSFRRGKFLLMRKLDRLEVQRFQRWRGIRLMVRQRRLQRLAAIRNHALKPWMRRHPRAALKRALIKKGMEKDRIQRWKKRRPGTP